MTLRIHQCQRMTLLLSLVLAITRAQAVDLANRVLVVYNDAFSESIDVANYYIQMRGIPASNGCAIHVEENVDGYISQETYVNSVKTPIQACADAVGQSQILYIVLTYLTPFKIFDGFYPDFYIRSIDSLLIDLWGDASPGGTQFRHINPYYAASRPSSETYQPFVSFAEYRAQPTSPRIYSVWRLDAPSAELSKGLVDKAIDAEQYGLAGQGCFDRRYGDITGVPDDGLYGSGDWRIHKAAEFASRRGYSVLEDDNEEEFGTPPAPLRCDDAALYYGWYSYGNYNDVFSWNPGAIGVHIDSAFASSPRENNNWSGGALGRGITVTSGAVGEPYLMGISNVDGVLRNLIERANVGDAFLRNTYWLDWMIINMGDPLYVPFPNG